MKISGTFDVELKPLDSFAESSGGNSVNRMSIDKTFHGDLEATSQGEMLTVMTAIEGSAGYVAIEQVNGVLAGKHGGFALQHFGVMHKGDDRLLLEVVPNSGSGDLSGLQGTMDIRIEEGHHYYDFDFELK